MSKEDFEALYQKMNDKALAQRAELQGASRFCANGHDKFEVGFYKRKGKITIDCKECSRLRHQKNKGEKDES